MPQVALYIG